MSASDPGRPAVEEEYVRGCLERQLGVPIVVHDDGSTQSMYDLQIQYPDRPAAPVEVTSDVDPVTAATLGTYDDRFEGAFPAATLAKSWMLAVPGTIVLNRLRGEAEPLLRDLEEAGVELVWRPEVEAAQIDAHLGQEHPLHPVLDQCLKLVAMGIEQAEAMPPGKNGPLIHLTFMLGGRSWDGGANHVVDWIEEFTAAPRRRDNLTKLTVDGAVEAHLAVLAHMIGVPWDVWRALVDEPGTGVVPGRAPSLPAPITHLWLFPVPGNSSGLGYDDRGWFRFDASDPPQAIPGPLPIS